MYVFANTPPNMKGVLLLAAHHSRKETGVGNPIIDKYGGECEGGYFECELFERSNQKNNERIGSSRCLDSGWKRFCFFVRWYERTEASGYERAIASSEFLALELRAWKIHEEARQKDFSTVVIHSGEYMDKWLCTFPVFHWTLPVVGAEKRTGTSHEWRLLCEIEYASGILTTFVWGGRTLPSATTRSSLLLSVSDT